MTFGHAICTHEQTCNWKYSGVYTHTHTHTHTHTMEYYSAIKKDKVLPFAATWMDSEGIMLSVGFPGGSVGKESTHSAGDMGLIPGSGRPSGRRQYSPVFLPGESR